MSSNLPQTRKFLVFAENETNELVAALYRADNEQQRDDLLQAFADKQGFFTVLEVQWDFYHYGKLAEIAEENQYNQLAEILRFAWKIDDYIAERKLDINPISDHDINLAESVATTTIKSLTTTQIQLVAQSLDVKYH